MEAMKDLQRIRTTDLTASSQAIIEIEGNKSLSLYTDSQADNTDVVTAYRKLMYAYPNLSKLGDQQEAGFLKMFAEAVAWAGLTKEQLRDSVMNCIAHVHQFGNLQIADVINYNKSIPLHSYSETSGIGMSALRVGDEIYWVKPEEAARYGYKVVNKQLVKI